MNPQLDSEYVKVASGNCERDMAQNRVQNPENEFSSVERRQPVSKDLRKTGTGTAQGAMPDSSRSCGKLQRDYVQGNMPKSSGCGTLQRTTRLDQHNLQVTDHGYASSKFEYCEDLTKPRKVHCKTGWEHSQSAVYWIDLGMDRRKA